MKEIKNYDEFLNEEFDPTQVVLWIGATFFFYKFWKGFFKNYTQNRLEKENVKNLLIAIQGFMSDVKSGKDKDSIAINNFNDRIFIRVRGFNKDIRIFKQTKIVQIGDDVKIALNDEDYADLIRILGSI